MASLVFSPEWFRGYDSILEFFSILVAFSITFVAWKAYRLTREARYKYFSLAFASIATSFLARFFTTLAAYITLTTSTADTVHAAADSLESIFSVGRIVYILLILGGYLILTVLSMDITRKRQIALLTILTILLAVLSAPNVQIFYFVSIVYLGFVFLHFLENYQKTGSRLALLTLSAFGLMLVELFLFLLSTFKIVGDLNAAIYVGGYVARVASYLILLSTFIKVWRK